MPTINWNENAPAGQDSAGLGPSEFRSLKTAIRTALDGEHDFPSAGGDAGTHRLGSGRPYVGLQSAVSSSGTDGRLMFTSDTSRLFHVGSGGTSFLGGPTVLSMGSYPVTVPQRHYWAAETGEGQTKSGTTIIFYASGFSGVPFTQLTAISLEAETMWVNGPNKTFFVARSTKTDGLGTSTTTFHWVSIGTRVF